MCAELLYAEIIPLNYQYTVTPIQSYTIKTKIIYYNLHFFFFIDSKIDTINKRINIIVLTVLVFVINKQPI